MYPTYNKPPLFQTQMFDVAHFLIVLYVCFMSPYSALQNQHSDAEKVLGTIVVAALLINIYIQLTTATYENVSMW